MELLPAKFAKVYREVELGISRRTNRSGGIDKLPGEFEPLWEKVEAGICGLIDIVHGSDGRILTAKEFMRIYTIIFDMCPRHSVQLYERYKLTLQSYTEMVLEPLKEKHGEFLLKEFVLVWENHKVFVRLLSKIFQRLEKYYVEQNLILPLMELGVSCFHDLVYKELKSRLATTIIVMVNNVRDGKNIDRGLVKDVIDIFVKIGRQSLGLYKLDFEQPFFDATSVYYSKKAETWMLEYSCLEYISKAEECLQREKDRVANYLLSSTEPRLLEVTMLALIGRRANQILNKENSGSSVLLLNGKHEDLSKMYSVFSKTEDGLSEVLKIFEEHVKEEAISLLKQACANNRKDFVLKAIKLHDKELSIITECFQNNPIFCKSLREAFVILWNEDIAGCSSAELVASFCDNILRNGGSEKLSDDDVEKTFEKITYILTYLRDKDLFLEFYRIKLGKRLLCCKSVNMEHERSLLRSLQMFLGLVSTEAMHGMMSDLEVARQHQIAFEEHLQNYPKLNPNVDLNVTLLKAHFWPFHKSYITLPPELVKCVDSFTIYYNASNQGKEPKKLTWMYSLGTCTITAKFDTRELELIVTTYQAAVLLLFNLSDGLSYPEIAKRLNLTDVVTLRLLRSLSCVKYKILAKEPQGKEISPCDLFYFNHKFTHELQRIKVPPPREERNRVSDSFFRDRRLSIDACIVRVMKTRSVMSHTELIDECLKQLSRHFVPESIAIKRRIENLIEREYMEREAGNIYRYKA